MTTENEDLDRLTAEERAILAEPDDESTTATQGELEDQAKAEAANQPGDDDAGNKTGEGQGGDDAGAGAAADDGAAAAAKPDAEAAAAAGTGTGEPAAAPSHAQSAPILVAQAPEDAEARLKEIADKKADLLTKFDDGDITAKEFQTEMDTIAKQERAIEFAQHEANLAVKMEQQRKQNAWDLACASFLTAHKDTYAGEANKETFEFLNATIMAFAKMPMYAHLTDEQVLDKAHRHVMAERGTPVGDGKPAGKAKQEIPKPNLPPNLAAVPAAGGNDPGEGRWASLDRLRDSGNGVAYEKALAALSEADRDAYLAA